MPRGFTGQLIDILKKHESSFWLNLENTRESEKVDFTFHGTLREDQVAASNATLRRNFSVVQMATGAGKTVVALVCIAGRKQPTLVIVHSKDLLYQWKASAKKFLGLDDTEIGLIGDGHKEIGKKLTIAIINTLRKIVPEVTEKIGFLIVDECHKVPSTTFSDTVSQFDCRYMLGLSSPA